MQPDGRSPWKEAEVEVAPPLVILYHSHSTANKLPRRWLFSSSSDRFRASVRTFENTWDNQCRLIWNAVDSLTRWRARRRTRRPPNNVINVDAPLQSVEKVEFWADAT